MTLGRKEQTSLYVVSYDIPEDRRRTRVHDTLEGFGEWIQYSLFECWLSRKQLLQLRARLAELINREEDRLRIYHLCEGCVSRVETVGSERPREQSVYFA